MRAYYGSRLSPNMTITPEGYLICLNVPIARTGKQTYLRSELGYDDDPNGLVDVYRPEEEVFSPATIASFEGKPVTDDHPPFEVNTQNIAAYDCGHTQNVRRGVGDESDLLIADLYITSVKLIEAIREGRLREVSCGYDADYRMDDKGRLNQFSIRGNHVAVVEAGRAGPRVAIKDSATGPATNNQERGKKTMAKKPTNSLMARLFSRAVKDMEPDEVADALEEITAASEDEPETKATDTEEVMKPAAQDGDVQGQILDCLKDLGTKLDALLGAHKDEAPAETKPAEDEDPLTKLEDEISSDPGTLEEQEDEMATPPEDMPGAADSDEAEVIDEDGPVAAPETLPENPIPGADRAIALAAIKAVRPVIAALPKNQRKAAADRATAEIRKMIGKSKKPANDGYRGISDVMRQGSKGKTKDSRKKMDSGDLGKSIMAKRNPHYKKA